MKRVTLCLMMIFVLAMAARAQDAVTLTHPIAYIGQDGNVYVTDGTQTAAITDDAALDAYGMGLHYSLPQWSHDGTKLAFMSQDGLKQTLWTTESGSAPEVVFTSDENFTFASPVFDWSPDDTHIAFFGWDKATAGIFSLTLADGSRTFIAPVQGGCIAEMGGDDPAKMLAANETGNSPYAETYALSWTADGILYAPVYACDSVGLVKDGEPVNFGDSLFDMALASDAPYFAARHFDGERVVLEIVTPGADPEILDTSEDAETKPVAWSGDALIYRTRRDVTSLNADLSVEVDDTLFNGMWGFVAENSTLTLWQHVPGSDDTPVFETQGYDFGVVKAAGEDALLVSVITPNVDVVTALNQGAAADDVRGLQAHPVIFLVKNQKIALKIDGGQPDISTGEFTAAG